MAEVVRKVVVENVPKIYNSGYTIRYRIVSEDRNRVSHWSPFHTFERPEPGVQPLPESVDGEVAFISTRQVSSSWEETNTNSLYDVYVKWDFETNYASEDLGWTYAKTVSVPTYNTLVPLNPANSQPAQSVKILVQQPTATKEYTPMALVFYGEDSVAS